MDALLARVEVAAHVLVRVLDFGALEVRIHRVETAVEAKRREVVVWSERLFEGLGESGVRAGRLA